MLNKSASLSLSRCAIKPRLPAFTLVAALALFAFAPVAQGAAGFNIDFGTAYGVPAASYEASSGQAGSWNLAGLGVTALVDVSGSPSDVSVNVVAVFDTGAIGGSPTNGDELLLNDNFYGLITASWSADLTGLATGDYLVFLYAPSNTAVPTGDMTVGGVPVASISGDAGSTLIEGTSWVSVQVAVTGGPLAISGARAGSSGLAGLQVVPLPEPSQVTLLASSLACVALLARRRGRG